LFFLQPLLSVTVAWSVRLLQFSFVFGLQAGVVSPALLHWFVRYLFSIKVGISSIKKWQRNNQRTGYGLVSSGICIHWNWTQIKQFSGNIFFLKKILTGIHSDSCHGLSCTAHSITHNRRWSPYANHNISVITCVLIS
jgi:hypothetical protein